ncbi:ParA family protein [Microbacterium oxydans]|uniref:ParA family protein n=2 Tax=Microbacterium oxydans TaxID=82380 RepID=UPI001144F52B|nr:ParA family protein [Microbacterium oxydans]KAB1888797.1 ParA family protein [Microbacterium oxydans]
MLTATERATLKRVLAISNRKGGVGKTSCTSNVGGVLAQAGYRVLGMDLDPQGHLGVELGYKGTDVDDGGAGLFQALILDQELKPVKNVRPGFDVIPGGPQTSLLVDSLLGKAMRGEDPSYLLAKKLAEIAGNYDVILIDCPPGENHLLTQAFVAARWVLIPTAPDNGSINGLVELAQKVIATRPLNPTIMPLGAVLFAIDSRAVAMKARKAEQIRTVMGDVAPVFTSVIRYSQTAGVDARDRGQLIIELAADAEQQKAQRINWARMLKARKAGEDVDETILEETAKKKGPRLSESAAGLANDYLSLTGEIIHALAENEKEQVK